jgi:hypothetical protein
VWDSLSDLPDLNSQHGYMLGSVDYQVRRTTVTMAEHLQASEHGLVRASKDLMLQVWSPIRERVCDLVWPSVGDSVHWAVPARIRDYVWGPEAIEHASLWHSISAYDQAPVLAPVLYLDTYLAPTVAHGLIHFNQLVSGYWLGREVALIVRRPRVLSRDEAGRLHHATGKCLEYHDGWGFYAWHGVRVPEEVIVYPDYLIGLDWRQAENVELRRIIQERMGSRFVAEMGGVVIDEGPLGRLYEVKLPGDPEQLACFVQVRDASTERQYFLRVPPWVETAAEAVAWSFGLSVEDYGPALET